MLEIEIEKILVLYFGEEKSDIAIKYFEVLKKRGQLFIGNTPLKDFSNIEDIFVFCQNYAKAVCLKFQCIEIVDDIAQSALLYILENCGADKINFDQEWLNFCRPYIVGIMKRWCRQYRCCQCLSLDKNVGNSNKNEYEFLADKKIEQVFNDLLVEDKHDLYGQALQFIRNGVDMDVLLKILADKNNISIKEILEKLKELMLEQDLIKKDSRGRFLLK